MKAVSRNILLAFALLILALAAVPAGAYTGFTSSLDTPPSYVSPYEKPSYEYSAALIPLSYPLLSRDLELNPSVRYSDHDQNSMRFEATYYRRGRTEKYLVPVSVDVDSYMLYKREKLAQDFFSETNASALTRKDRKRGGGLGINVALPKRLDQIFGEGGAGLTVTGYRRITFAGRSQWSDVAASGDYQQSKFPSLRMEQISRFDITGTIGSKITVKVSQDNQTDIPLANRIQIRYKGDEDEVLQSIEAGNTTLSLPNTKFVGYSSRIRGLFGLKAEAQLGNFRLIGIASQEKGSSEKSSFTATGEESAQYVRDYEYVQRRIFDLGTDAEFDNLDSVTTLYIYESESRRDNIEGVRARLYVNPDDTSIGGTENVISKTNARYNRVEEDQYIFYNDPKRGIPYVVFNSPRYSTTDIGLWMVIKRQNGAVDTVGNIQDTIFVLKLLSRSENDAKPTHQSWGYMWRNTYSVPRGSRVEDIDVKIFKGLQGSEGTTNSLEDQQSGSLATKYIEILGLDQYNSQQRKIPDQLLDERQEVFRPDWGLIIFPSRTPFASDTTFTDDNGVTTPELEVKVPEIYDYVSGADKTESSEYYLQLSTKTRSNIIKLNRANIIEGSERVTVNGRQLERGTEYNIQYDFGQITLLSDEANDPNANIVIDYEYAPFFAVQKKSLFGMRAEYEWSSDFKIGSTFLYKSDKAQDRKPKVGQETARMSVYDVDMNLKLHPNFLTTVVDALPLIETETPSNMSVSGEVAQSHPNPNVEDIAYVDDFESALDQLSLGTSRTNWSQASFPQQINEGDYQRGQMLWHTPRGTVRVEDVYDREARQGEGTIRTLRMIFRPNTAEVDTTFYDSVADTATVVVTNTNSWAGISRYFGNRVDANKAQLFEVRLRGSHGKLHFDFGEISEDINGNSLFDTEDTDNNGAVSEDEDVGLDGLSDELEPGYDPLTNPDPNGDNWYFEGDGKCPLPESQCDAINWDDESIRYEWLNGTEGNLKDPGVLGIPDEEGQSNAFSTANSYFSYVLDLATDSFMVENSEKNGWITYRIPIRDPEALADLVSIDGEPEWSRIRNIRVWFEADPSQTAPDTVEIAAWYFVQSSWRDSVIIHPLTIDTASFIVASVSEEENTNFVPPPGVEAYKDPTSGVTEAQRALLLKFENLNHRDTCIATKDLITVDRYSGYRNLEMYVYGGTDPALAGKIKFFFRLGRDAQNYYEYQTIIQDTGWSENNYVNLDFNEISALKDEAQRNLESGLDVDTTAPPYRVFGNPNMNEVRYFAAGLISLDSAQTLDGELWLDELRVTHVRKDVGSAGRVAINGNMADLLTYNFSFESQDPYFRGLSSATRGGSQDNLGSGRTQTNLSYGVSLNVDKFLPRSWGTRLPVSFNYAKSVQTPLLRTNSDIVLPEERRKEEQSISESKSVNTSLSFNNKEGGPLFSVLLNRMKTSFSYRRSEQKSVTTPYNFGENYNVRGDFDLSVKKPPSIRVFFWTKPIPILKKVAGSALFLYPDRWTTGATYSRNLTVSDDINFNRRSSVKRDFAGAMDISYKIFPTLSASYHYETRRDLSDLDDVNIVWNRKNFKLGVETHFAERLSASYDPKLFTFFTTQFSYKAAYADDWERSNLSLRSSLSRDVGVSGKFDHRDLLGGSGASGHQSRRRGASRRGGQETEEATGGPKFYEYPIVALRFLTGWIEPVNYSYSESYRNSLPGMATRPNRGYRFGFRDEAEVDLVQDVRTQSSTEGQSYDLGSGFTFLGGIGTTIRFKESVTRDLVKQGTRYENISTSWPDLSIRISQFRTFPLVKKYVNKFIEVFSPRTGYSRQVKETRDINNGFTTTKSVSKNYNPLLALNFKLFRSLSLSASYGKSTDNRKSFNQVSGKIQTETVAQRNSIGLTAQYSFSSPHGISIPLFGKVKFNSTVDISLSVKMNKSKSETSDAGGPYRISEDKSDLTVSPVISYTFSRQIKGGITVRWQDSQDNWKNQKSHTREVQIWTEIRF